MKKLLLNAVKILFLSCVLSSCSFEPEDSIIRELRRNRYRELVNKVQCYENIDVVFFGDSQTHFGNFENRFSGKCLNLGIGGDKIDDLRNRIFMVEKVSPKKIFLCVGINNLEHRFEKTKNEYRNFIIELKNKFPDSEIYLESLIPLPYVAALEISNYEILKFNIFIQDICKDYDMTYIDLFTAYLKDGYLNEIYSRGDGIHLNDSAYDVWYEIVAEYLE
jgi:lysophospholipase L1-like esterase